MIRKVLTIRQPWAWAVLHAGKRIENRSDKRGMPPMCKHRGELWIHAACTPATAAEWNQADDTMRAAGCRHIPIWFPPEKHGLLLGRVQVVGHVEPTFAYKGAPPGGVLDKLLAYDLRALTAAEQPWYTGDYGLVLADPEPLPGPIPWRKGQQGLWNMPDELAAQLPEGMR